MIQQLSPFQFYTPWEEVRELRRQIELDGLPDDPEDVLCQFVDFVKNAEGLRVAFHGQWDETSRREAIALYQTIKSARPSGYKPTTVGPPTLQ